VIQMDQPDPDNQPNRRKLYVPKSKALKPPALGVTMGAEGNEYDTTPPTAPDVTTGFAHPASPKNPRLMLAAAWLKARLNGCAIRVRDLISEAEQEGYNKQTLYRAKDTLSIDEIETEGKKWWRVRSDDFA
jgi:hypothetical protein